MKTKLKTSRKVLTTLLALATVVGQAQTQKAPATTAQPPVNPALRVTYDTLDQSLNTAFIDIDLINACNGQKKCEVKIEEGKSILVEASNDNPIEFLASEGNAADGVVREHAQKAALPSNPCVSTTGGLQITDMNWKTHRLTRNSAPGSFKGGRSAFVGLKPASSSFGTYSFKDPVNKFCFEETVTKRKGYNPVFVPFAVVSIRIKADFKRGDREITFSENMKRSTQPLLDRVQEAISNAQILLDEEDVLLEFESVVKDLQLMNATLMAVRSTLRPSADSQLDFPSPADPRVSEPMRLATTIWVKARPGIEKLKYEPFRDANGNRIKKTPKLSRKDKRDRSIVTKHYSNESFRRHISWLSDDMEALKSQFAPYTGGEENAISAKVVRLMLAQLSRLRASGISLFESKDVAPEASVDFMSRFQEVLSDAHKHLSKEGSESQNARAALQAMAELWNSEASQKVIKAWSTEGTANIKRNFRGLRSLFEPLIFTTVGSEIEFENGPLSSIAKADDAQGGRVLCNLDAGGEYCWVDLISQCAGRTACSTKLSFNGHWVTAMGRTGRLALTEEVTGMAMDGADAGTYLPGNTEVCSDLPITSVRYYTKEQDLRWTYQMEGRLMSPQIAKDVQPIYPMNDKVKMSEKCVVMDAASKEGSYAILSVKVKLDLDKDRSQMVPRLMLNAGRRLLENTRSTLLMTEGMNKVSPIYANLIKTYRSELTDIEKTLDSKTWFDTKAINTPITDPKLRQRAERLFLTTQMVLATLGNQLPPTAPLIVHLKGFARELQLGFGFDSDAVVKTQRTVTPIHPDRESVAGEFDRNLKSWERQLKQGLMLDRMLLPVRNLIAALRTGIDQVKQTPADRAGMGTYMLSDGAVLSAKKIYLASAALSAELSRAKAEKYKEDLNALNYLRSFVTTNFKIDISDVSDKDLQQKPILELLSYAISVAMQSPDLKWANRQYEALESVQAILKNDLIADGAANPQAWASFLAAWESPANQVGLMNALAGSKTIQIVNSAIDALNQSGPLKTSGNQLSKVQE